MASVFTVIFSIKDAKGKDSSAEINVPNSATLANVILFASSMATLIDPLLKGQITRVAIALNVPSALTGLKVAAIAGSDVEEGAKFQFVTDGGNYTSVRLATFDEDKIASDSRLVDTADADVAAFVYAMLNGVAIIAADPTDKRGEDIVALDSALESFQSSRA